MTNTKNGARKFTTRTAADVKRDAIALRLMLAKSGPMELPEILALYPGIHEKNVRYTLYKGRDLGILAKVPLGTAWMAVTRNRPLVGSEPAVAPEVAPPKPKTNGNGKERDDGYNALGPRAQAVYRQVQELNAEVGGRDRDTWLRNAKLEAAELLIREGGPAVQSIALELVRSARGAV